MGLAKVEDASCSGFLNQFSKSKQVLSFGRVQPLEGSNIYDRPDTTKGKKEWYQRNTRVFVCRRLPGDWYFVRLDNGKFGYIHSGRVWINPPDPGAYLYRIKEKQGAQAIAMQEFLEQARNKPGAKPIQWGMDWRHYVRVLVYANQGPTNGTGKRGIVCEDKERQWDKTKTTEGVDIWIPSLEFALSLKDKLPKDSVTYSLYQAVVERLGSVGEYALGYIAFEVGILHGALESVWDLLTGIIDLLELLWKIVESVIKESFFSDLSALWKLVKSLKISQLFEAGLQTFVAKWNHPNFILRWHFRGWVVGYAIAEIVMAIITAGAAIVKWVGKAGKIGKLLEKLPQVVKAAEKVTKLSKSIPDKALQRLKKAVPRTPDKPSSKKRKYVPYSGRKYIEKPDPVDEKRYAKILETLHDAAFFSKLYDNTGVSRRILERVHKHIFHTVHKVPVGPNKIAEGYFTPDPYIGEIWTKAMNGKLSGADAEGFRRLMAHEYVESKLMKEGFPYRSANPEAWDQAGTARFTTKHHGAHDLAPLDSPTREPFSHWPAVLGVKPHDFKFAKDLDNLDELVEDILKIKRGWK